MESESGRHTRLSLVNRLRSADDPDAWAEFVRIYGPIISAWCLRRGLQQSDAEDVTQTVLMKLAHRMKTFCYDPAAGSFRAYLHTLSKYAVSDFLSGRREIGSGDSQVLQSLHSVASRDDLMGRFDDVFDQEIVAEGLSRVRQRVEERTWLAFEQTAVLGLSVQETASRLSMSIAGVYQAKSRILKLVREEVAVLDTDSESLARVHGMLHNA